MTDLVLRAVWRNPEQAKMSLNRLVVPWCRAQMQNGHELSIEVRLSEDEKTDRQRRYYHGVIIKEIAQQARPCGSSFPFKVWKEHFRKTFLGYKTVSSVNPITGKRTRNRVRISTEDLSIRKYSELIDKVTAFAVTELGVCFSHPRWETYQTESIDPETGEIMEVA